MSPMLRGWIWKMAFRDARRRIKPMLLAMSCVVLGVAAIVASFSFRDNLQTSVSARAHSRERSVIIAPSNGVAQGIANAAARVTAGMTGKLAPRYIPGSTPTSTVADR